MPLLLLLTKVSIGFLSTSGVNHSHIFVYSIFISNSPKQPRSEPLNRIPCCRFLHLVFYSQRLSVAGNCPTASGKTLVCS